MCAAKTGEVFVVSSPSGAGKSVILNRVRAADPALLFSVSATTRRPRAGERDGREYYFVSAEEFRRRVDAGEFLEWAEVHGNLYGTLRSEMERLAASGQDAVVEIDVQGAASLRAQGFRMVSVFIMPPSVAELELRLIARGTDDLETIKMRVAKATEEIAHKDAFDVIIVNDQLASAQEQITKLLTSFINS